MRISLVVAHGENREIGKDNQMLWHLPLDFKKFKQLTTGHTVIMGRKTFESIGRPLPRRRNVILTRSPQKVEAQADNVEVMTSLEEALKVSEERGEEEVFIIGGGEIYHKALPLAHRLYISKVHESFAADTYFPPYEDQFSHVVQSEEFPQAPDNNYPWTFTVFERP